MLTAERRSIMHILLRDGKVLATELSKMLHVSEDTIRRDLRSVPEEVLAPYRALGITVLRA